MKFIIDNKGHSVLVDDEVYDIVSRHHWCCQDGKCVYTRIGTERVNIASLVIDVLEGYLPDHIDRDVHDARRVNLRLATKAQNAQNASRYKNNTTGYKGVSYHKASGKFIARIQANNIYVNIGSFLSAKDAAIAYNKKAQELHGQFAVLNLINENINTTTT